jgi:hypothetical protein
MSKIEVKYKTRSSGLVVMPKESMEEAENLVRYLKQLSGFEVLGIFVNGKLVERSKPEKEWKKQKKRTAGLDEYKIEFPKRCYQ